MKPIQRRPAGHRHRGRWHLRGAVAQSAGDHPPRRTPHRHHAHRRPRRRACGCGRRGPRPGHERRALGRHRSRHRHRDRTDRRLSHRQGSGAGGDRERQARGHRQQGIACGARQRDLRGGLAQGRDGGLRGRGRRRHPDHQGIARRPHGQPHRMDRRHHQRHHQLHPVRDARQGAGVRGRAGRGAAPGLCGSRSHVRHRRCRRRPQGHDPVVDRVRRAGAFDKAYVEGITKLQSADIRYAEQLGYRIKLLGITRRRMPTARCRASSCACIPR
jgi:hypothetical protein